MISVDGSTGVLKLPAIALTPIGGANPKRIDNHLNTTKESLVKNFNAFGATLTDDETKKLSGMDFFL
ncbi:hypothetical protein JHK85_028185 [Glycine max]|nr:hypothetical protein JHK85_028185 [Glycine max]